MRHKAKKKIEENMTEDNSPPPQAEEFHSRIHKQQKRLRVVLQQRHRKTLLRKPES